MSLEAARAIEIARLYAELRKYGQRYKDARAGAQAIRDEAEPIIVSLANLGEEQLLIADAFQVVRETIRRIEIANGVDRGDPRAAPGSRAGRPAKVGQPAKVVQSAKVAKAAKAAKTAKVTKVARSAKATKSTRSRKAT